MQNGYSKEFQVLRDQMKQENDDLQQKYGIHFEYFDLCRRLKAVQQAQLSDGFLPSAVQHWKSIESFQSFNRNQTQEVIIQKPKIQKVTALNMELVKNYDNNPGQITTRSNHQKSSQKVALTTRNSQKVQSKQRNLFYLPKNQELARQKAYSLKHNLNGFQYQLQKIRKQMVNSINETNNNLQSNYNFNDLLKNYSRQVKRSRSVEKSQTQKQQKKQLKTFEHNLKRPTSSLVRQKNIRIESITPKQTQLKLIYSPLKPVKAMTRSKTSIGTKTRKAKIISKILNKKKDFKQPKSKI